MNIRPRLAFTLAAALWLAPAAATAEPMLARTIDSAAAAAGALHARLGKLYPPLLRQAKAVLIAPAGGRDAVLLLRAPAGWGEPAFFTLTAADGKTRPRILLIMSERALDAVLRQNGLPLDGPTALSLAKLGTARPPAAELLLWAPDPHARLDPAGPQQDDAANATWYGHPRNAADIVGATPAAERTARLRRALAG